MKSRALVAGLLILSGTVLPVLAVPAQAVAVSKPIVSLPSPAQSGLANAGALSVQWVPSSWLGHHGSAPAERSVIHASLEYESAEPLRDATLRFTTNGPLRLLTPGTVHVGTVPASHPTRDRISFQVYARGSGSVEIAVSGIAPDGAALRYSSPLNFATGSGHVAIATNGLLSAEEGALRLQERALGRNQYRLRLFRLAGGGASQTFSAPDGPFASPTTDVRGVVQYKDRNGTVHPCRDIYVQVYDLNGTTGTLLTSTKTNSAGDYSVTVSTLRSPGKPRSLYVRSLAANAGFQVVLNFGDIVPQHIDSTAHTATGATQTVNLVANNTADNNTAFDVADMLVTGDAYVLRIHNNVPFPRITASYPNSSGTDFMPGNNTAEIVQGDRFDWDVVLHEFGHYVAFNLKIDTSKGGHHQLYWNLGEPSHYGKDKGTRLAWSEGFATWFALTAEHVEGVAAMHIPYAGDWTYDDTEDRNIHEPLTTPNPDPDPPLGEDNEVTVARFLYHVFVDPDIVMSDKAMIAALVAAKADTLSKAVPALMKADNAAAFGNTSGAANAEKKMNDFACLLTTQLVSPKILTPGATDVATDVPIQFTWQANGAGPHNRLNKFNLQIWSPTWGKFLWLSPGISALPTANVDKWTPTQAQWNAIMEQTDENGKYPDTLNVTIVGSDTNKPVTGPYDSCALPLAVAPITASVSPTDTTDGVIAPIPSAFSGGLSPLIDQFTLNASNLMPNTAYSIQLSDPNNGYGPVTNLKPSTAATSPDPPNSVTTNSGGAIVNANITIPDMPSELNWPLILTPLGTLGQVIAGRLGRTTFPMQWDTVGETLAQTGPTSLYWGGAGVKPGTSVTLTWDNGTMYQASQTVTSLSDGQYYYSGGSGTNGSLAVFCVGGGADTITVRATTYDGATQIGPAPFVCNAAGPNRGGSGTARYFIHARS